MAGWTQLRNFASATEAEAASVAAAATFVDLGMGRRVEVRAPWGADAISTGSTGPSAVVFAIWRKVGSHIDKVGTLTCTVTSNATVATVPALLTAGASEFYATVESFTGGATPTVAGKLYARTLDY